MNQIQIVRYYRMTPKQEKQWTNLLYMLMIIARNQQSRCLQDTRKFITRQVLPEENVVALNHFGTLTSCCFRFGFLSWHNATQAGRSSEGTCMYVYKVWEIDSDFVFDLEVNSSTNNDRPIRFWMTTLFIRANTVSYACN